MNRSTRSSSRKLNANLSQVEPESLEEVKPKRSRKSKKNESAVEIPEPSTNKEILTTEGNTNQEAGETSSATCRQKSENALDKMSENYQRSDRESLDEVEKFACSGPLVPYVKSKQKTELVAADKISVENYEEVLSDDVLYKKCRQLVEMNGEAYQEPCIFCNDARHDSVNCLRFASSHQRSLKLAEQNICEKCLGWKHENQDECPCKEVICQSCVVKWPELKSKINHHPVVCYSNAMPHIPKIALIPKEDPTETICVFCDDPGHESMYCRKFSTSFQRRRALKENKLCMRCLERNNRQNGKKHIPCPKIKEACPNCVDIWPGKRSETHHHVLVCHWIPLPDKLQKQNNICKK